MDVLLDVRDSTPRGAHHLQRGRVQGACYVEPEEYLHVFDLGGERERAPLGAAARLGLQVVEALEVVLQEGLTGTPDGWCGSREPGGCNKSSKVSARSSSLTQLTLRHTQKIFAILKEIYAEEVLRVIFFLTFTKRNITCSSPAHSLTVASLKSSCGSVDGELLPVGVTVGAVKHRPGRSETKTQMQGSSMTCISQT